MAFDENNYEMPAEGEEDLPEESNNNRTFMIAVGILGGLILVSIACLGVVYLFSSRSATAAQQAQAVNATQTAVAANDFINQALTATFEASMLPTATLSPTPTATPPVSAPSPTNTVLPTVPVLSTPTGASAGASAGTQSAATATVAAALTQAVAVQKTVIVTPAMPKTGIADEYGLPGLIVMALAFIIVILFARRLRFSPTR